MALLDGPRSTSYLAILLAGVVAYIGYTGDVISLVGLSGLREGAAKVAAVTDTLETLQTAIQNAKQELARGSAEEVRRNVEQYKATLSVLRQFVPEQSEVPDLLDDITSRAKIRGVNLSSVVPEPVLEGPEPFNTYEYGMAVIGRYDQIGAFLSDVASLRRIIVPTGVAMTAADPMKAAALGDSSRAMLEASFKIKTFVKAEPGTGGSDGI
jgi:Tfp pilus assembly protein PilO